MALTVRELTEIPYLRTRLFAGSEGANRSIGWAHSIELPRPWEWLEPGDLLMTVGLGIPAQAEAQVDYVKNLAAVGVAGVAIGEGMQAPPLSDAMIAAADAAPLPLLMTAYEVPFIQVSRAVAAGNRDGEYARVISSMRVYDSARLAVVNDASPAELLRGLGNDLGCRFYVCDNERASTPLQDGEEPPEAARAALLAALAERDGASPGLMRLAVGDETLLVIGVPARRPASLLVLPRGAAQAPPFAILQHVATVAALQLERLWASREEQRRLGSETLAHLVDGRIAGTAASAQLRAHGLDGGPFVVVAVDRAERTQSGGWLHHALADRAVPNALLRRETVIYCLVPAGKTETVIELLSDSPVGVSVNLESLDEVRRAAEEARWALDTARLERAGLVRYGEQHSVLGPRSIDEARAIVDRVLGGLVEYDQRNSGELIRSLRAFLGQNRSWQRASAELHVHKQTLVYRMRRVEELSGRSLSDTAGVSDLWLALEALERLDAQPS